MPTYTERADVAYFLPPGYSTTVLPNATVDTIIDEWSSWVDDNLPRYWTFNDVDGSPVTPKTIQEITTWAAAFECRRILQVGDFFNEDGITKNLLQDARDELEKIRTGAIRISKQTTTDSNIAFGTSPLETDEYKFSVYPKEVVPESVQISGYERGEDFYSYYSTNHRAWILVRLDSAISDGDDDDVTFDWSYLKQREIDTLPFRTGEIGRG